MIEFNIQISKKAIDNKTIYVLRRTLRSLHEISSMNISNIPQAPTHNSMTIIPCIINVFILI
jgi:hypothetical protein